MRLVEPVEDRGTWWWVVVPSEFGLDARVYRHFDEMFPDAPADPVPADALLRAIADADAWTLADALHNDLEAPAVDLRPPSSGADRDRRGGRRAARDRVGLGTDLRLPSAAPPTTPAHWRPTCPAPVTPSSSPPTAPSRAPTWSPMPDARANLVNLERVSKSYGVRPLLTDVSLGIRAGERIGIVGRNGDGKTTFLEVMTGLEEPDAGGCRGSAGS